MEEYINKSLLRRRDSIIYHFLFSYSCLTKLLDFDGVTVETIIKTCQKSKLYLKVRRNIGFRLLPFSKMGFARQPQYIFSTCMILEHFQRINLYTVLCYLSPISYTICRHN